MVALAEHSLPSSFYFYIVVIASLLPFIRGFGYREFGEPCEPPKTISVNSDGSRGYGNGRYLNTLESGRPYTESPRRYQPQGQNYYKGRLDQGGQYDWQYQQNLLNRHANETRKCRSEKGLRCDAYTRRCKCFELAGASWSHERDRCEFIRIGTFCSPHITEYAHHCLEYAECTCNWQHWDKRKWYPCNNPPTMNHHSLPGQHFHDTNNGKCMCIPGYRPNEDYTGCWYSHSIRIFINKFLIIALLSTHLISKACVARMSEF